MKHYRGGKGHVFFALRRHPAPASWPGPPFLSLGGKLTDLGRTLGQTTVANYCGKLHSEPYGNPYGNLHGNPLT